MAEPIAGYVLPQQFYIRLTCLYVGASHVFVAVTEREIGVCTRRRTVLRISGHVSSIHVHIVQLLPAVVAAVTGQVDA